ncbi:MAG: mannosyltransferase B-like protein [uncultured bacterium]|nr:MAG: mannosyltransferase B-like protein [uncultured bacterium]
MRIGIDGRSLLETEPSGVSIYTAELIRALAQLPHAHELKIFLSGANLPTKRLAWLKTLPHTTIHHLRWPNKLFHCAALFGLAPKIDMVCGGVDVLFAPNWHMLPRSVNVPLVLTVHDMAYTLYPQFLSWRRQLWHLAIRPAVVLRQAKKIIAVSQTTAASLQAYAAKVTVVHSAVPSLPSAEPVLELPQQYVVCVGTLEPRKNLMALVAALQRYRSNQPNSKLHLVLLGSSGWRSGKLRRQLQQDDFVHYFGYITPGQKRFVIERAAALFYPSIYEGFGFPPLEALAVGTPVVTSNTGALPEVLGLSAWYCNPYSQQDLVTLLQMFAERPRINPPYYQSTWQSLHWQNTAAATLRVLEQAVY